MLRNKAQAYCLRLAELTRLDHDLQYVKEIIEEVMRKEDLEEVVSSPYSWGAIWSPPVTVDTGHSLKRGVLWRMKQ